MKLENMNLKVFQYWQVGRGWNWARLAELLPTVTLMKLASVCLALEDGSSDQVGWLGTSEKNLKVSSAYKLAANWNSAGLGVGLEPKGSATNKGLLVASNT